jgi:hypothetical protein
VTAPTLKLHKSQNENASPLAPPVSIPGAIFATPSSPAAPGAPAGGAGAGAGQGAGAGPSTGNGLPRGSFGFGGGLRGSLIGCVNADTVKLTPEERAKCAERFGEGAKVAPVMDPIGTSRRGSLDDEAAQEAASQKYRDSAPTGTVDHPIAGQPRALHPPGQ